WMKMKESIGAVLIPAVTKLVDWLGKLFNGLRKAIEGTIFVKVALAGLAAFVIALAAPILVATAPWLLLAAAIGAVVLIITDIVETIQGKDTLLSRFFDSILGKGATAVAIAGIRDIWRDIVSYIKAGVGYMREFSRYLEQFSIVGHVEAGAKRFVRAQMEGKS